MFVETQTIICSADREMEEPRSLQPEERDWPHGEGGRGLRPTGILGGISSMSDKPFLKGTSSLFYKSDIYVRLEKCHESIVRNGNKGGPLSPQ
jgi:hypothetical protein